ncbi:MAG: GNAT family N-acetyltransferase, partial [Moraxellaceae bacterium]
MSLLDWWRQRGWQEIDRAAYQRAHTQFGGSVITHPEFIHGVSSLTRIPLSYFGCFEGDSLIAAAPVWQSYI